jgi:hypothetical protein
MKGVVFLGDRKLEPSSPRGAIGGVRLTAFSPRAAASTCRQVAPPLLRTKRPRRMSAEFHSARAAFPHPESLPPTYWGRAADRTRAAQMQTQRRSPGDEPAAPLTGARQRSIICSSVLHAHINNLVEYSESREKHHEFRIQVRDDAGGCSH